MFCLFSVRTINVIPRNKCAHCSNDLIITLKQERGREGERAIEGLREREREMMRQRVREGDRKID